MSGRIGKIFELFNNWIPVFAGKTRGAGMKSSRGFSIIGSLLGFSLLGLSTVGLATYMGSFEQVKVTYAQQANVNFVHLGLLGSMQKIITLTKIEVTGADSKIDHPLKTQGLCKIVNDDNSYDDVSKQAICPIMLKGISIGKADYYEEDRWKYFVQQNNDWTLVSADKCSKPTSDQKNGFVDVFTVDHLNKCVQYSGETQQEDIYARLSIIPQKLPLFDDISNSDNIPVDELTYKLKTMVSIPRQLEPDNWVYSLSKSEKYLWSTEVLDCHVCLGTDCVLARFSTMAQGTAARHSRICYHSMYEAGEKQDALEIKVEKISPEFEKSADRIVAANQLDHSSACRASLFRCGSALETKDFDPTLKFRFLLDYDQPQDSYINEIDLKVTNDDDDHRQYGTLFVSGDQKARIGRDINSGLVSFSEEWPLRAGTNDITAFMGDQNTSAESICKDICSSSTLYYPELTVKYGGSDCDGNSICSKDESFSSLPIACYQCNMKSCHRYGVNTYKKGNSRDAEPLDGSVPECLVEKAVNRTPDLTEITSGAETIANKCLKTASGRGLQTVNCVNTPGTGGPIFKTGAAQSACFSEGETKPLKGGYTGGLDARNNCLQVLQEEHLIGEAVDNVWREGVLPSLSMAYNVAPSGVKEILEDIGGLPVDEDSGDKYVFNNYARFSTFFGDHKDIGEADVFVPFQRDASGMFHSGWHRYLGTPQTGTIEQRERWAFFYREPFNSINLEDAQTISSYPAPLVLGLDQTKAKQRFLRRTRSSRPVYIKMDSQFHPDYPGVEQRNDNPANLYLGLIHHLAFKGIRPIETPSDNTYSFLCRNIKAATYKEAFVTTTAESKAMSEGYAKCRELGSDWYFIPPDSRELWAAALQAVAPNSPRYPFPNPFAFVDGIPFQKELKAGDTGYDSKKHQWELSYKYEDMPSEDYLKSEESDHEFFFNKERGVLAGPATAWIGGLAPVSSSGGSAGVSWNWKPDWEKILGPSFGSGDPEGNLPSLLFTEDRNAVEIDSIIAQLNSDTDMSNIGAINENGRVMSIKSLKEASPLNKFHNRSTKLCRYNASVKEVDFHKALIITGKGSHWPSEDDCGDLDAGAGSKSFLANHVNSIYFEIPSTPGNTNLANLTGSDFVEIRQGLRVLAPLLAYHKHGAIHIQNKDKFCRFWKREKKRRAVGNCMMTNYNDGTLSKAGVNHGLPITRNARGDASICHAGTVNCGDALAYFQNRLGQDETDKDKADARKDAFELDKNLEDDICANATGCSACVDTVQECRQTCWDCIADCSASDREPPLSGAEVTACENACRGRPLTNNCAERCGCTTPPNCAPNWDCSERNTCQQAACVRASNIQAQIDTENAIIGPLNLSIACQKGGIGSVSTASCISSLDVDKHVQDYAPYTNPVCSSVVLPINFDRDSSYTVSGVTAPSLTDNSYSRCWPVEDLKPSHEFTFNDGVSTVTGRVGVLIDGQGVSDWDQNAKCNTDTSSLHTLNCDSKYVNLIDLHDNLCDESIDYGAQTCEANYEEP